MSNIFTRVLGRFFSNKEKRVVILGYDGSGKTSILYRWVLGEMITTMPTLAFGTEKLPYRSINFTMLDSGGGDKIKPLWHHYFVNASAVIFVIDSSDREHVGFEESGLRNIAETPELRDLPFLILANKQDLPGALSVEEIRDILDLDSNFPTGYTYIQGCSVVTQEGINEGLDWLHDAMLQS